MIDRGIVLAKVAVIEECISRVDEVRARAGELRRRDVEELTIFSIQRAVQAGIDIATHVVAEEGLGMPETLADSFRRLAGAGIVSDDLAEKLRRMVGFRNVVVHAYETVDPSIVEEIVTTRLDDLRELCRAVIGRFSLEA